MSMWRRFQSIAGWVVILLGTVVVGLAFKGIMDAEACGVYAAQIQAMEICTEAEPGSAMCLITPSDLVTFRNAVYRGRALQCKADE